MERRLLEITLEGRFLEITWETLLLLEIIEIVLLLNSTYLLFSRNSPEIELVIKLLWHVFIILPSKCVVFILLWFLSAIANIIIEFSKILNEFLPLFVVSHFHRQIAVILQELIVISQSLT